MEQRACNVNVQVPEHNKTSVTVTFFSWRLKMTPNRKCPALYNRGVLHFRQMIELEGYDVMRHARDKIYNTPTGFELMTPTIVKRILLPVSYGSSLAIMYSQLNSRRRCQILSSSSEFIIFSSGILLIHIK